MCAGRGDAHTSLMPEVNMCGKGRWTSSQSTRVQRMRGSCTHVPKAGRAMRQGQCVQRIRTPAQHEQWRCAPAQRAPAQAAHSEMCVRWRGAPQEPIRRCNAALVATRDPYPNPSFPSSPPLPSTSIPPPPSHHSDLPTPIAPLFASVVARTFASFLFLSSHRKREHAPVPASPLLGPHMP